MFHDSLCIYHTAFYFCTVQQFTSYTRDAKLQQMPYVYISWFYRAKKRLETNHYIINLVSEA